MSPIPTLRPLGETLSTEVCGINLATALDAPTIAWIHQTFAEHPVLVFRDQDLGANELAAFGRILGVLVSTHWSSIVTPTMRTSPGSPTSTRTARLTGSASNERPTGTPIRPSRMNCRCSRFCMRRRFRPRKAAHSSPTCAPPTHVCRSRVTSARGDDGDARQTERSCCYRLYGGDKGSTDKQYQEKRWPAITRHPVTGMPILFVNPMHTHGFEGMTQEEAWPLIDELTAIATDDRFVYYHHWRVGDVLMWDERATMHRGAGDSKPEERRVMLRTSSTRTKKPA